MWPVRNKTIIGLKCIGAIKVVSSTVRNKTIIGLKSLQKSDKAAKKPR